MYSKVRCIAPKLVVRIALVYHDISCSRARKAIESNLAGSASHLHRSKSPFFSSVVSVIDMKLFCAQFVASPIV